MFNAPLFFCHVVIVWFHSEILPLRDFIVRYHLHEILFGDVAFV
jgi:hypothetical protein